jgi:multidrug efflux system outer membrane protein
MCSFSSPVALLLAGVLAGCTLAPKYDRPPAPVPETYPEAPDTSAAATEGHAVGPAGPAAAMGGSPAASAHAASDVRWKAFFTEERLGRIIEIALADNRDLRVALLDVEQAQAQYRVTRSASFPTIDATASFTRESASALDSGGTVTSSTWAASVGTTAYELDLFGRVRSLNAQALENYLATVEGARNARLTLVAQVATQYFTLRASEEQLALAQQTLEAVEASYRLNRILFDAGESNELDVRTAEGQVQTARINILNYELQRAQALDALVLLVGAPLPADLPPPRPFEERTMLTDIPAGLPSALVRDRPDILQAEHTLKAANADIGAVRAAFFPTISLTGSLGSESTQLSQLFGAGTGIWTFAPQISLPIFTGGLNRANLDVAKVSARIDVANYEKAIQTAFREVADALAASAVYERHIEVAAAAIAAQLRRVELSNLRYRQGEDLYLNVLSAQQDLYSAQQDRLQALFNKLSSQISLYEALGGGWQ